MPPTAEQGPGVLTAEQVRCLFCPTVLQIVQHREREIRQVDGTIDWILARDKGCPNKKCPHPEVLYRPNEEFFLALPGGHFSREMVIGVGFSRFKKNMSFPQVHAHVRSMGATISLTGVQDQFGHYLALVNSQIGVRDEKTLNGYVRLR